MEELRKFQSSTFDTLARRKLIEDQNTILELSGRVQELQNEVNCMKFPTPATFACWKIRFKTEVCTCSQFATETMQWIKEVELVDSADELKTSSSIRGISMPNLKYLMRGLLQR